ncbi:MAG: hypothetical protein V1929_00145 [bacterium]
MAAFIQGGHAAEFVDAVLPQRVFEFKVFGFCGGGDMLVSAFQTDCTVAAISGLAVETAQLALADFEMLAEFAGMDPGGTLQEENFNLLRFDGIDHGECPVSA